MTLPPSADRVEPSFRDAERRVVEAALQHVKLCNDATTSELSDAVFDYYGALARKQFRESAFGSTTKGGGPDAG